MTRLGSGHRRQKKKKMARQDKPGRGQTDKQWWWQILGRSKQIPTEEAVIWWSSLETLKEDFDLPQLMSSQHLATSELPRWHAPEVQSRTRHFPSQNDTWTKHYIKRRYVNWLWNPVHTGSQGEQRHLNKNFRRTFLNCFRMISASDVTVLWIQACIPIKSHSGELYSVKTAVKLHLKPESDTVILVIMWWLWLLWVISQKALFILVFGSDDTTTQLSYWHSVIFRFLHNHRKKYVFF